MIDNRPPWPCVAETVRTVVSAMRGITLTDAQTVKSPLRVSGCAQAFAVVNKARQHLEHCDSAGIRMGQLERVEPALSLSRAEASGKNVTPGLPLGTDTSAELR